MEKASGIRRENKMKIEGIITPIVTPFYDDAEQNINYEATADLINHLIARGVKGILS